MNNVMVVVLTPDEAMKELDKNLEKTCEIMGLLYHKSVNSSSPVNAVF